ADAQARQTLSVAEALLHALPAAAPQPAQEPAASEAAPEPANVPPVPLPGHACVICGTEAVQDATGTPLPCSQCQCPDLPAPVPTKFVGTAVEDLSDYDGTPPEDDEPLAPVVEINPTTGLAPAALANSGISEVEAAPTAEASLGTSQAENAP